MADEERKQPSLELPRLLKRPSLPTVRVGPMPAALLTGLLVGLLGVGLTWSGLFGCAALRGTSTCGDPGLLVAFAIFLAMGLAGTALLRLLRVQPAASTSALATALVAVVSLLLPRGSYQGPWVMVVVPVAGALAFAAAYWVTSTNTDPGERPR